jgi:transcriptional regulator with XRE-family HTH domain
MNIGQAIKLCRVRRGLTQGELAAKADMDTSYISLLEGNKRDPSLSSIQRIAAALDIPLLILFFLAMDSLDELEGIDRALSERLSFYTFSMLLPYYPDTV